MHNRILLSGYLLVFICETTFDAREQVGGTEHRLSEGAQQSDKDEGVHNSEGLFPSKQNYWQTAKRQVLRVLLKFRLIQAVPVPAIFLTVVLQQLETG